MIFDVFGLPELINCDSKSDVACALDNELAKESILRWDRMSRANSTELLCKVFSDHVLFYEAALFASTINSSALRIFLIMWTGLGSIHIFCAHERACRFCDGPFDSRHYFGCSFDACQFLQLIVLARNRQFAQLVHYTCD
jgi:hypothetical protein